MDERRVPKVGETVRYVTTEDPPVVLDAQVVRVHEWIGDEPPPLDLRPVGKRHRLGVARTVLWSLAKQPGTWHWGTP